MESSSVASYALSGMGYSRKNKPWPVPFQLLTAEEQVQAAVLLQVLRSSKSKSWTVPFQQLTAKEEV